MEQQLRALELQMKNASGGELEQLLSTYSRLNHTFELENGYAWNSEVTGVLKGLGFGEEEFDKLVSTLSGGQKTRISLGRLLLSKPDIILLDEPTNHLDMESIAWLESYLKAYDGAVIIVAHDRYFLNRVVSKIIELEQGKSTVYQGDYTAYSEKKAMIRTAQMKAWLNQQQEIRHQEGPANIDAGILPQHHCHNVGSAGGGPNIKQDGGAQGGKPHGEDQFQQRFVGKRSLHRV